MNDSQRKVLFWVLLLLAVPAFTMGQPIAEGLHGGHLRDWVPFFFGVTNAGVLVGAAFYIRSGCKK